MHFNFHLSGDEPIEQLRRIANAVLALGGETPAKQVSELTMELNIDTSRATEALDKLAAHPGAGLVGESEVTVVTSLPDAGAFSPPEMKVTEAGVSVTSSAQVLDVNGLPWDDRIHSSSRARNADGSWRMKRGVQEHLVKEVEAELKEFVTPSNPLVAAIDADVIANMVAPPAPQPVTPPVMEAETYSREPLVVPPIPPLPPVTEPTPVTYANVVNLIMSKNWPTEVWWPVIGESLPAFAATCQKNPAAAGEVYAKLQKLEG